MATLKDVAARCGLDISTVSRALRDDPRVRPETRALVRKAAEELHYTPNLAARNLVRGKSCTITLITSSLTAPMERLPAQYASTWLQERDYDLMISLTGKKEDIFERQIARLEQNLFDGALIIPGSPVTEKAEKILRRLDRKGFPLVYLDRWDRGYSFPVVTTDNRTAGAGLAVRLMDRGCTTVIILSERQNGVEQERVDGESDACRKRGVKAVVLNREEEIRFVTPSEGPVGIIATSYSRILSFVSGKDWALAGFGLYYGVFDEWPGAVYPATEAIVCGQDFEGMAQKACGLLVSGEIAGGKLTVPVKEYRVVKGAAV